MSLIIADTPLALEKLRIDTPSQKIAFVPTMGNLHQGHLNLVKLAAEQADRVIVSLFVNRLQFAPHEDFDQYPRTQSEDIQALEQLKLTIPITVFAPTEQTLYPSPQRFRIKPDSMADTLEGAFRPGFFEGVCTVVMKLFQIVQPHYAVFGKKDRQQLTLIKQMIQQFCLPITLLEGETQRDTDGLALSSRNRYLNTEQRQQASELYQQLSHIAQQLKAGKISSSVCQELEQHAMQHLNAKGWNVDYIAIRDRDTLSNHPTHLNTPTVILGAAKLGQTRLIDNIDVF